MALATVKDDLKPSGDDTLIDKLSSLPTWAIQAVLALLCSATAIVARIGIDWLSPGASPFILIYPAVMVATLLGRWQAGCLTLAILILNAWYVLIPLQYKAVLVNGEATDWLALAFASGVTTIIMAELIQFAYR
jgi:hypothetical protein